MCNKRATILIISLWILVVLSIFALSLAHRMSIELKLNKFYRDKTKVFYLAKAGIKKVITELRKDTNEYDSLNERWSCGKDENEEYLFKDIALGDGLFNINYISGYNENEEPLYFYGALDEDRKINVNKVTADSLFLHYLFKNLEIEDSVAEVLSNSIKDWIDENEDGNYENYNEPISYKPRNGPIKSIEELRLVQGMTDENFDKIKDYLTTFGEGKVNINTTTNTVLASLFMNLNYDSGFSQTLAEKIINSRNGPDGNVGTGDDSSFDKIENIKPAMQNTLTSDELVALDNLINSQLIDVKSDFFRIHSTGTTKDGKIKKEIETIVERAENVELKIVYWHEN